MDSPLMMKLMASSIALASTASSIVRRIFLSGNLAIVDKGINDLQTQADRSIQHCIVRSLTKQYPGLCIVGEETLDEEDQQFSEVVEEMDATILKMQCPLGLRSVPLKDVVVWIDPLDGTNEFTAGLVSHTTILIGIAVNGRPVGGVVCQPFYVPDSDTLPSIESEGKLDVNLMTTRVIWALEGLGLFGMKSKLPPGPLPFPIDAGAPKTTPNIIVTTRSHPNDVVNAAIDACAATKVLRVGGCGYKVLLLLEGLAHAYVFASPGCKKWDTCAPEALLNAAGGRLTSLNGAAYAYDKNVEHLNAAGLLAVPVAEWHDAYLKRMPSSVLQTFTSM